VTASSDPSPADLGAPAPLVVAVALAALEAVVLVVYGLSLIPVLSGERLVMGASSVGFFLVYGGALGFLAWQLRRLRSWARAPVVLAQLLQVMVGASFWGGATSALAVGLVGVALATLAGIFHPASIAALDAGE
jgi:hypothetical protein